MIDCPLDQKTVEFYLQILFPAYKFTITFQRTKSSIAEVVPAILNLFNIWTKLCQNKKFKPITEKSIEFFKMKFDYELSSDVYSASAILNTSKLNTWFWNSCSEDYINNAAGIMLNAINKTVENSIPEQKKSKKLVKIRKDPDDELFGKLMDFDEELEEIDNLKT